MKTKKLKNSLATFAFTLAIVASFAFKPDSNDLVALVPGYLQFQSPEECLSSIDVCALGNDYNCTVSFLGVTKELYGIQSGTNCYFQLSFP